MDSTTHTMYEVLDSDGGHASFHLEESEAVTEAKRIRGQCEMVDFRIVTTEQVWPTPSMEEPSDWPDEDL